MAIDIPNLDLDDILNPPHYITVNKNDITLNTENTFLDRNIIIHNSLSPIQSEKDVLARPTSITSGDKLIEVTPDEGYNAMEKVNITVPLQFKSTTITPTSFDGGNISVTPNAGKLLSSVTVIKPTETKTITENGTGIDVAGYGQVDVDIPSAPQLFSAINYIDYNMTSEIIYTTNTSTNESYQRTITHGLGVVPDLILFYATSNFATTYSMLAAMWGPSYQSTYKCNLWYHTNSTSTVTGAAVTDVYGIREVNENTFKLKTGSASSNLRWRTGNYKLIAIKF